MINIKQLLRGEVSRHQARAEGCVVPEPAVLDRYRIATVGDEHAVFAVADEQAVLDRPTPAVMRYSDPPLII